MPLKPIFLFSISRTGSTLIQRIIAAHEGVATRSEPWLLLPHAYTLRPRGIEAEYVHPLLFEAIEDFSATLPRGEEGYLAAIREFALRLYEQAADDPEARYFLDKSPPYCLVAEEIMRLFPEGKFVFLWRNMLSVTASMIETWGPWRPNFMSSDLFLGLPRQIEAYEANRERSHAVRFEDLVSGDTAVWNELMDYLEIPFEPAALTDFAEVELVGRMGDPTGRKKYSALSGEPQGKWKKTLANPIRRAWCRRYLQYLGARRLALMGYDLEQMIGELEAQPASTDNLLADLGHLAKDVVTEPIRVRTRKTGAPNVIRELLGP